MAENIDIVKIKACMTKGAKPSRTLRVEIESQNGPRVLTISEPVASELMAKLRALQLSPHSLSPTRKL
jgi:hypothetical protein